MDVPLQSASASDHPVTTIFLALGATIGLPFVVLGSTSPLLQVWWARREGGGVPYRLFALSNAGSLLALVLYPTVVEPRLTLASSGACGGGFLVFMWGELWLVWRGLAGGGGKAVRAGREYPTHGDEAAMDGASRIGG
jgi:hypothetical protein